MAENDATPIDKSSVESLKKRILDSLYDGIMDAMINGRATLKDGKESAHFILGKFKTVKTKNELLQFLYDLSTKWSVYSPYYVKMKYSLTESEDTKKIQELKNKLYNFIRPN
ncbi:MAG: hypothetical protein UR54_C0024G0003 [Candidatus Roizmanbacteria bacterium GW2011_GWA2_34_18]|uniref:Uncharacterized protein n=1 Tax=Candidatus Roizmanbacteria bacterium GW2011_GWA2_34_18 TaxID=1618477 RepID=A0A0G0DX59_9BACT|nr:MAG: hypothetical protein UR54_C0024G0003 [Candidatus Roizmanbacteria bacterium GW2011_GWA2_34_18]